MKKLLPLALCLLLLAGCMPRGGEILLPDRVPVEPAPEPAGPDAGDRYILAEGRFIGLRTAAGDWQPAAGVPLASLLTAPDWQLLTAGGALPLVSLTLDADGFGPGAADLLAPYGVAEGARTNLPLPTVLEGAAAKLTFGDRSPVFDLPEGALALSGGQGAAAIPLEQTAWEPAADLVYALVRQETGAEALADQPAIAVLGAADLFGDGTTVRLLAVQLPGRYSLLVTEQEGQYAPVRTSVEGALELSGAWRLGEEPLLLVRQGEDLLLLQWTESGWQTVLQG